MDENILLLEKYFPKNFDELILPVRIKTVLLKTMTKTGFRILLYSSPGTGKTTTSRLMTVGHDVKYLSGSNDFKIDTFRNTVVPFSSGFSVLNKSKTVIIDECENIQDKLQDAFKIVLDKCMNVNYIFITNEIEKVNEAIRSRCTNLDYDFIGTELEEQKKNFIQFCLNVCKSENINFDKKGMNTLFRVNFPDFRHVLVHLQEIKDSNEDVTFENIKKLVDSGKQNIELYSIIENLSLNGKEFYEEMTKFKGKERESLLSLGEPFFEYLNSKELYNKTLEAAIIVDKYSTNFVSSIGKFGTLLACIVELRSIFR